MATPDDGYMDLKTLAAYSAMSIRSLRRHLEDVSHPLPCYRIGGKIVVRQSQFDQWVQQFESRGRPSLALAVKELGLDRV
jgi:hypothetical protein